ncbi:hypothetical protein CONLIGDRAFT_186783 [Coniochaeta ligniaria NRRL 30616]|uniref:Uncharacterized protein n=1 Tax=Coniochaeta ligniaria NRRL 30616 TaxID=1408157 RepID=A0A1J7K0K3_9PEZI|nr:hypothetical protein CONLIGDRAFT_186783 [Coniochaeta ligniaria NRRL 30616]
MSLKNVSPFAKIWYKWKTLPLPWRRQVLAGVDLKGNTFWELRDKRAAELGRVRRMVKTPRSTHYGEVVVSPAWHQWLRHTRFEPPSVDEQRTELLRQERIKALAAQADARWAAQPSVIDGPEMGQAVPALRTPRRQDATKVPGTLAEDVRESMHSASRPDEEPGSSKKESWGVSQQADKEAVQTGKAPEADPWKQADTGAPGQNWQPKGWNPSALDKRRG